MKELKAMDNSKAMFPPAIQWRNRTTYLFPIISLINAGMGLPLALVSIIAFLYALYKIIHFAVKNILAKHKMEDYLTNELIIITLLTIMILTVFIYQGGLYTMNMRYFISIYPALCVLSGYFIFNLFQNNYIRHNFILKVFLLVILISTLIWPISFFAIYQRPHSRVIASEWIYEHIPSGSTLTYEIWDDPLPLHLPEKTPERYKFVEMPMYDPDVSIKWQKVVNSLEKTDYIIMSSNRLWGSIPRVHNIYPLASKYYQALFDGSLGFEEVADITSTPCFPTANYCLFPIDDSAFAEESFTVYDHPQVLIFKKNKLNEALIREWIEKSQEVKS